MALISAQPLHKGKGHLIERADSPSAQERRTLIQIYSALRSHNGGWPESLAWGVAATILNESERHSLDPLLVLAVINVESRFQHTAVSGEGARGLMQLRPITARASAQQLQTLTAALPKALLLEVLDDPILNIQLGTTYLGRLKKSFKDTSLALAAYHRGPTEIRSRLEEDEQVPTDYTAKVLSAYQAYGKD